jgi:hypothetical protein
MGKPRGKTPSLLTMSTGTPALHTCGKATSCNRCDGAIATGATCFQIPKMNNGFTARPLYCVECTSDIVAKTRKDVELIEQALKDI